MSNAFEELAENGTSSEDFERDAFDNPSSSEKEEAFSSEKEDASGFTSLKAGGGEHDASGFASLGSDKGYSEGAGFTAVQENSTLGGDTDFISMHSHEADNDGFASFEEKAGETRITRKAERTLIKAEETLKKAWEKAALVEKEAYEKGFEQGVKDGTELGERKAVKVIENIEKLLVEIGRMRSEILKRCEEDILEIIFTLGKKIIHHQLESDEEAIKGTLQDAVALASEKNKITLRVNPEDFDYVERLRPEFFTKFKELKSMTVTSDPSISRGGCLLETPCGEVDARIETQFEMIHQSLKAAYLERAND